MIDIIRLYNAHGHKLCFPAFEKAQFVTALGITTKSISTDQTPENIAQILEALTESPVRLEALSKSVSAPSGKMRQPLGKGERTPTEVLAHVINTEARSSEMIYQALLVKEPFFADIHPEREWGKLLRFD